MRFRSLLVLTLLLPTTFAGSFQFAGQDFFLHRELMQEERSSIACSRSSYDEQQFVPERLCHLFEGSVHRLMADRPNHGAIELYLYDVTDLEALLLQYQEVDLIVQTLRTFLGVQDGTIPLEEVGSDGRELFLPTGLPRSTVVKQHVVDVDGEMQGVGFFYIEGAVEPGAIVYQLLFYREDAGVLGGLVYYLDPGTDSNWSKAYEETYTTPPTAEEFRGFFEGYVDQLLTKPHVSQTIARLVDSLGATTFYSDFTDVSVDHKFYADVSYLYDAGIVNGYEDGTYGVGKTLNRAEFLTLVYRAAEQLGLRSEVLGLQDDGDGCFEDVLGGEWYAQYVCAAKEDGIVRGYEDGTFKPAQSVNLAESMKIMYNVLDRNPPQEQEGEIWYRPFLDAAKEATLLDAISLKPDQEVDRGSIASFLARYLRQTHESN